jgi:hypothetical protein
MPPIPPPRASTVRKIYEAYEQSNKNYEAYGISVGELGTECDRALWYSFRWISQPEQVDGRKVSIFRTGERWEEIMVEDLERIGVEVFDRQDRIRQVHGFVRGKCDGKAIGVPEAPKTIHLCEFKSSNDANFKQIVKHGCQKAKPAHYAQCQIGMHQFGYTRCLYYVTNKNTDERYVERIKYDMDYCIRLLARAERIVFSDSPPSRISDNPEFFGCRFCRHHGVCHEGAQPRTTCRSCIHAQPERGGDCQISCARWSKPLSIDEQREACPAHLYLPGLIDGEQVDCSEEEEWIEYRLRDGTIWRDGGEKRREAG